MGSSFITDKGTTDKGEKRKTDEKAGLGSSEPRRETRREAQ
jgi:hypothetical protein